MPAGSTRLHPRKDVFRLFRLKIRAFRRLFSQNQDESSGDHALKSPGRAASGSALARPPLRNHLVLIERRI
jgi:hypothetical protein